MGVPAPLTYPASGDCVLDYALRLHTRGRGRFALSWGREHVTSTRQCSPLMAWNGLSTPFPRLARGAPGEETRACASSGDLRVCLRCAPACGFSSRGLDRS